MGRKSQFLIQGKFMLQRFVALLLATLAILSVTPSIAGEADFTLVNQTGYTISEVYIAPAKSRKWGKDRLGDGELANGRSKLFKFSDSANCVQDIQVVFADDGSEVIWEDLDLCEINKLTLRYNRATKTVTAIKE